MDFEIRPVRKQDIAALIDLCEQHAAFEKSPYQKEGKVDQLSNAIFQSAPKLYCLVVLYENSLVGYATYMKQYSTWDANEYMYMDCLFLTVSTRGLGIGEKIMEKIYEETIGMGCKLIQWQTPEFNTGAAKFYTRIGANAKNKIRFFKEIDSN